MSFGITTKNGSLSSYTVHVFVRFCTFFALKHVRAKIFIRFPVYVVVQTSNFVSKVLRPTSVYVFVRKNLQKYFVDKTDCSHHEVYNQVPENFCTTMHYHKKTFKTG